jgi:hypothetical protein
MALNLQHQTLPQFLARFRARFKGASKAEACRLAAVIIGYIDAGDVTDAQIKTAFGLTAGQWTTLKAKLNTMKSTHEAVQAAGGE